LRANILEPGQLSLFDIPIQVPKPKEIIKEKQEIQTIKPIKCTSNELTESQKSIIDKFKSSICLHKIIKLHNGYLAVVLKRSTLDFTTVLYNSTGKEELRINDNIPLLPCDKVIFCKSNIPILYKKQETQLAALKEKYPDVIEIRRKGDNNVILLVNNITIAINPKGWILEFKELKAVYTEDEVISHKQEIIDRNFEIGNKVEIEYEGVKHKGEIVYKYDMYDAYNVAFNGKQTAIHASRILRKIS
jgi:hypothetical protein